MMSNGRAINKKIVLHDQTFCPLSVEQVNINILPIKREIPIKRLTLNLRGH